MGRKPLFEKAMTATEHQRRWRARVDAKLWAAQKRKPFDVTPNADDLLRASPSATERCVEPQSE
jgi:hypothetical protein